MNRNRIALLVGRGASSNIVYNALKQEFEIATVIEEAPVRRAEFLRKRARKLGTRRVLGQVLFRTFVVPWLGFTSSKRKEEILRQASLSASAIPESLTVRVSSANDTAAMDALRMAQPDVVVVNGTRIISQQVLDGVPAPFVNMHTGITPQYRGVHGAYWALVGDDRENCGVTIHLVDRGIDTGGILAQARIEPGPCDNFLTYTYLQLAAGIPLLKSALRSLLDGAATLQPPSAGTSRLWTHPTLGEYLRHRLLAGVK